MGYMKGKIKGKGLVGVDEVDEGVWCNVGVMG